MLHGVFSGRQCFQTYMFIGCFFADLLSHSTHFGERWTEAVCTASLAAVFSYMITLSPAGKKLEEYLEGK